MLMSSYQQNNLIINIKVNKLFIQSQRVTDLEVREHHMKHIKVDTLNFNFILKRREKFNYFWGYNFFQCVITIILTKRTQSLFLRQRRRIVSCILYIHVFYLKAKCTEVQIQSVLGVRVNF